MFSILRLFLLSLLFCMPSFPADRLSAQERGNKQVLRAVYTDYFPYSITARDGTAVGFTVDLTLRLAKEAGYEVEFVFARNPRQILDMLERGEVDVTPLFGLSPARRAAGLATTALGEYELSVFVRRDRKITQIEELSGKRVGVVSGLITQAAAENIPFTQVIEYQTPRDVILPLLSGEIDAVVGVSETFDALLRRSFVTDKIRRLQPALMVIPYGLVVRRELPEVQAAFDDAIARVAQPAQLGPLRAHWFGSDPSIMEHPWFGGVLQIMGGMTLTFVALVLYVVRLRRRSVRLLIKNGENQLLIDALDKMRAAIVIFDSNMRAIHWNSGFEGRFPRMVPLLRTGADLEQTTRFAYKNKIFETDLTSDGIADLARSTAHSLRDTGSLHRMVRTPQGSTFDLSMFCLGSRHHAAIWVDVTDLHQQQERIESQSAELKRKNQQLSAFSVMAAHDLKAPLVQQATLMEFITEDMADAQMTLPTQAQGHFDLLVDLSERMRVLVHDLLDYAKADTTQATALCFAPDTRLDAIIKMSGATARIAIDVMPDMPAVQVDPNAFDMVMRNLISNAIKHHDATTGHIWLRAYRAEDMVVIEVQDDGPGIAEAHQDRVFEAFSRLTKVEGTGLGLAFVKKTVVAWGGKITVRAAPERGCIFAVTLPSAPQNVITLPSVKQGVTMVEDKGRADEVGCERLTSS